MTATVVKNANDLADVFKDIENDINDMDFKEPLNDFTETLDQKHQEYFDTSKGPSGEPWLDWRWRQIDSSDSHPTLDDSGTLRASLREGGLGHVEDVSGNSLVWGTSIVYAGIHNFGGTVTTRVPLVGRGGVGYLPAGSVLTIPQREHVGINDQTLQKLVDDIADSTVEAMIK